MALFSMRVQVIKRSAGRSVVAAAAYRSGEKLHDDRQNIVHDYSRRKDVERTELMLPATVPSWVQGISREAFWNRVDANEKRKDAQTARELRLMLPRGLPYEDRIRLVRDYVTRCFVNPRGMCADVAWHNKIASDGQAQPHAHVMLTMRPLTANGFGLKSRHDFVPDPEGRTHPDGRPVMIESNSESWNSSEFYENTCRVEWERAANVALARVGSSERIDRRSLVERGLARLPEPALRLAFYLKELRGVMRERFGQFQAAKFYQDVEKRAKAAFVIADTPSGTATEGRTESVLHGSRRDETPVQRFTRFFGWIERQIERLAPPAPVREPTQPKGIETPERAPPRSFPTHGMDMER